MELGLTTNLFKTRRRLESIKLTKTSILVCEIPIENFNFYYFN